MKYVMDVHVQIREKGNGMNCLSLREDQEIELHTIGEAGEILLRIHQLIATVHEKATR